MQEIVGRAYIVSRSGLGVVRSISRYSDSVTVPLWDGEDPITIELREWEAENGMLDLSTRPQTYTVFRNGLGKVDAVNRDSDGATVPIWDEADPLTVDLREWEAVNGALDLSDRPPPPKEKPPDYKRFYADMMASPLGLFGTVRLRAKATPALMPAYFELGMAIQLEGFPGFQSSVTNLFNDLATEAKQPFTLLQKQEIRRLLDLNGFTAIVLPLVAGEIIPLGRLS